MYATQIYKVTTTDAKTGKLLKTNFYTCVDGQGPYTGLMRGVKVEATRSNEVEALEFYRANNDSYEKVAA